MKIWKILVTVLCLPGFWAEVSAQQQKVINKQSQSWISFNSTIKVKGKFGFLADVHVRRNNFLADPNFYFIRGAVNYWHSNSLSFALGYGHMWVAPSVKGNKTYADENRIYQQVQYTSKIGKLQLSQRLRNELRWQEIIVQDKSTHANKFTDRIRYQISFTLPLSKDIRFPSLVLADEIDIQFGKDVVYNTFDQNRAFIGLKQTLTPTLSFDIGYMYVTQQKSSGFQYDQNDTFRWFFYYNPDWRKKK
jgi:hypothetical protein